MPRRFVPALGALAAAVVLHTATAAQQQQPPVFRSGVTLVGVDVTVLNRDGTPVTGLTAEDFRITLDGTPQPVRTLSYVQVADPVDAGNSGRLPDPIAGARLAATNTIPVDDAKVLVVAVDDLSFAAEDGRRLLSAAQAFVERQPANVLVGLTTTGGAVAVNPTFDRASVIAGLRKVVGTFIDPRKNTAGEAPIVGLGEAIEIAGHNNTSALEAAITRECLDGGRALQTGEYGAASFAIGNYNTKCASDVASSARVIASLVQGLAHQQIAALAGTVTALKEAPGLKQLIVLTQGIAGTRDLPTLFEPIATAASTAGVQLAVLTEDDEGIDMTAQDNGANIFGQALGGSSLSDRRREDRRMFGFGLQALADMSGGTFERVIAEADGAFRRAARAGSAVYRLGVEAPVNTSPTHTFVVRADVARDGVTLRVNHRTVVPSATPVATAADRVKAAIRTGTPFYGVPLRVGVAQRRAAGDQVELEVDIDMPASVAGPVRVTIGVLDGHGALKQGVRTLPRPPDGAVYRHVVTMPVAAGAHHVRVAAEDASGRVGSVTAEVDARLHAMGPVTTSDLLTWWKDPAGERQWIALDRLPAGATSLGAGIELYPVAGQTVPDDLTVRLSIVAAGSATPVAEVALTPRAAGDLRRAEANLPLANLAPGSYVIRASVHGAGKLLGEVSAAITLPPG